LVFEFDVRDFARLEFVTSDCTDPLLTSLILKID